MTGSAVGSSSETRGATGAARGAFGAFGAGNVVQAVSRASRLAATPAWHWCQKNRRVINPASGDE